ncbi:retrotransposon protein, putative, ty1-copia subclass, partial [Tanacetum coccineum]
YMTRSSTKELVTPYKEPKRVFRSSRKLSRTRSLDYLSSLEFNLFSDPKDQFKEEETEFDEKAHFELKGQFLKELRDSTFSGTDEDANEHIEKVLEIVDLFHIHDVTQDQIVGLIALVAIIDRQIPFEYTIASRSTDVMVMALPVQNINHSAFRSMFEREKLSYNNFNDWLRQLKLVLRVEKKMFVIEQPLPATPAVDSEAQVLAQWHAIYDAYSEVSCVILGKEGKPVGSYVLKMKGYVDQRERLGYVLPQDISVGLILNGLTNDFAGFIRNYNMHNMGKTVGELHALLIEYEKGLPKKVVTPQVMAIQVGRIHKVNKKSQNAKGKGKGKGKGKEQNYIPKLKNPKPSAKERPAKDDACYHCKEVGHWKRNCSVYLAELIMKKKQVGTTSSSGIFTIELFYFPKNSCVYDTGSGTYIYSTKQGLRGARKLKQGALYLYMGNGVRAQVEAIGSYNLVLSNGLVICLDNCHYAPTITRGVVSVSRLIDNGVKRGELSWGCFSSAIRGKGMRAYGRCGERERRMIRGSVCSISCDRAKLWQNPLDPGIDTVCARRAALSGGVGAGLQIVLDSKLRLRVRISLCIFEESFIELARYNQKLSITRLLPKGYIPSSLSAPVFWSKLSICLVIGHSITSEALSTLVLDVSVVHLENIPPSLGWILLHQQLSYKIRDFDHCKVVGHWKRNCSVYLAELIMKKKQVGTASSSGIFTIELFYFPKNSCVYDTSSGTYICSTKQGLRGARKLKQGALYLYMGNGVRAQVEAIRSYNLVLSNGLVICLDNCHYAPTITRGVVSVSRLIDNGFTQSFIDYGISVSKNKVLYFNVISSNGIYETDMTTRVPNVNSIYTVSNKRVKHNLDSTYLWHCHLAHISKKCIKSCNMMGF